MQFVLLSVILYHFAIDSVDFIHKDFLRILKVL